MGPDPSRDAWLRDNKESHPVDSHVFPSPAVSALAFWEKKSMLVMKVGPAKRTWLPL